MTSTPSAPPPADAAPAKKKYGLKETVRAMSNPRVAGMAALGFSSGMPFMLTGATFGYWLRDEGTELTAIGFLSWVGLAYTFKVFWAPMVDKVKLPVLGKLGQRRSWAILVQIIIAIALLAMATVGPHGPGGLAVMGAFALVVAFASATQDIAVDAWRIEEAQDADELGTFTSAYQLGYRIALLVTDALILVFANHLGWPMSYTIMALLMGVGLFAALRMPEPKPEVRAISKTVRLDGDGSDMGSRMKAAAYLRVLMVCPVGVLFGAIGWKWPTGAALQPMAWLHSGFLQVHQQQQQAAAPHLELGRLGRGERHRHHAVAALQCELHRGAAHGIGLLHVHLRGDVAGGALQVGGRGHQNGLGG